jgi:ethanolamine ammonia-lyase small subunit
MVEVYLKLNNTCKHLQQICNKVVFGCSSDGDNIGPTLGAEVLCLYISESPWLVHVDIALVLGNSPFRHLGTYH